jgi:hypothetical protein
MAVAAALLCLLIAGCGGAAGGGTRLAAPAPPIDENLWTVLPGGSQLALHLDLDHLRGSPIWELTGLLDGLDELARLRAATGIDPLAVVDEALVVAADRPGQDGHFAVAIKGRFDARAVVAELVRTGNGGAIEVRGRPAAAAEDLLVIALTDRTLLAGTPAAVEESLAAAFDGGRSLADDPEFAPIAESRDAVALRFRQGKAAPDFSKFGTRRMPLDGLGQVVGLDARLSAGSGLAGQVAFTCHTRLEASALAKDLRTTKRDLSRNPIALLLGVDWLFEKIVITAEGSAVEVRLVLDDNDILQIRRLVERLEKIRSLAEGASPRRP